MHAVHNARIQLLAMLLKTMAGSSFTVGVARAERIAKMTVIQRLGFVIPPVIVAGLGCIAAWAGSRYIP
jgi:hypothetical protein